MGRCLNNIKLNDILELFKSHPMPKYFLQAALTIIGIMHALAAAGGICIPVEFLRKYEASDFVARVTITSVSSNVGDAFHYQSGIAIRELYKGRRVQEILIEGSSDGKIRTTSDLFFPKNTEILVYARLTEDGQYIFDSCSGYLVLGNTLSHTARRELDMLEVLKRESASRPTPGLYQADLQDQLKALRGVQLSKSFAIFEITFSDSLQVATARTVSGFTQAVDERLKAIISHANWTGRDRHSGGKKQFIAFYYYEAEKGQPSFIGTLDV